MKAKEVNKAYTGSLSSENDVDYYSFSLAAAGKASVNFRHIPVGSGDWEIQIWDAQYTQASGSYFTSGSGDATLTSNELTLPAGDYYVKVNKKPYYSFSNTDYVLTVNGDDPAGGGSTETWTDWPTTLQKTSHQALTISFSQNVDSSTLSGNIFVASDQAGQNKLGNLSVSLVSGNAKQVRVLPSSGNWQAGTYYLFISSNVKSASSSGQSLQNGIRMTFDVTQ